MNRLKNASKLTPHDAAIDPALDVAIVRALAQPPLVAVPGDFAARVAQRAAAQPQQAARLWLGWGPRLAIASGLLLTAGMFALAPHTSPSLTNLRFDAELVLFAELSGLALFARRLLQD